MSSMPAYCARCQVDGACESVVPFEPEREQAFAVYWKCPRCTERLLMQICPLGPWLAPTDGTCLNCGHGEVLDGKACPNCGIRDAESLDAAAAGQSDAELLRIAREEFARGTCRRGLTMVNYVLQRNPRSGEAWSIKGQFFEYLGYRRALKAAMQEAVRIKGSGTDRAADKWWQFWK